MTHKEGNFGVKEKMQNASTMSALTHKKGNFRGVGNKSLPHNLGNRNRRMLNYGKAS
jgi:hypothetical protein